MTPTQALLLLAILILGGIGLIGYLTINQIRNLKSSLKSDEDAVLTQWLKEMKSSMDRNTDTLEKQLNENRNTIDQELKNQREAVTQQTKVMWERLENTSNIIGKVQEHLGGLNELGKDMKDLNNILKSPKLRGGLGEQFLYEILEMALPHDLFRTQHKFKDGAVCDAIIYTDRGIIPIDSKFPMEKFREMINAEQESERESARKDFLKDVKKRIDEVADKYILPEEGTTEQAIMYIPSENVFYEIIVHSPNLVEYAQQRNVLIASPNTFSFFVKTVLVAYRQHEFEKNAKEVLKALGGIKVEAGKFGSALETLSRHITNAYNGMENVSSAFTGLFGKIKNVQSIEKPTKDKNPKNLVGQETVLLEDQLE